jgi:hypothetical protein
MSDLTSQAGAAKSAIPGLRIPMNLDSRSAHQDIEGRLGTFLVSMMLSGASTKFC